MIEINFLLKTSTKKEKIQKHFKRKHVTLSLSGKYECSAKLALFALPVNARNMSSNLMSRNDQKEERLVYLL